mmetsp:Transcript_6115/g.19787  ORF Transcript_6115/g.19787 Transcript_6115/m.19787 type:complete len:284 (-) Transcript_6115:1652-2503(-)
MAAISSSVHASAAAWTAAPPPVSVSTRASSKLPALAFTNDCASKHCSSADETSLQQHTHKYPFAFISQRADDLALSLCRAPTPPKCAVVTVRHRLVLGPPCRAAKLQRSRTLRSIMRTAHAIAQRADARSSRTRDTCARIESYIILHAALLLKGNLDGFTATNPSPCARQFESMFDECRIVLMLREMDRPCEARPWIEPKMWRLASGLPITSWKSLGLGFSSDLSCSTYILFKASAWSSVTAQLKTFPTRSTDGWMSLLMHEMLVDRSVLCDTQRRSARNRNE